MGEAVVDLQCRYSERLELRVAPHELYLRDARPLRRTLLLACTLAAERCIALRSLRPPSLDELLLQSDAARTRRRRSRRGEHRLGLLEAVCVDLARQPAALVVERRELIAGARLDALPLVPIVDAAPDGVEPLHGRRRREQRVIARAQLGRDVGSA